MPRDRSILATKQLAQGNALRLLRRHVDRLKAHDKRTAHGNRSLHTHTLFIGLLLAFYNPVVRSLRLIEDCRNMNGRLDLDALCRSTTSDALATCDPELLTPIIHDLRQQACALKQCDSDLHGIAQRIIAADGTYLSTLADIAWSLRHTKKDGRTQAQVRLNVQMEVRTWTPQVITVSGDDGSEPSAVAADLLADVVYVVDRNFVDFDFLKAVLKHRSQFVVRAKCNAPAVAVIEERPLNARDRAAGVTSDQIVNLTGRGAPSEPMRLVTLVVTDRKGKPQTLLLLSSLTSGEVSAAVIGEIYRLRWQIELFFRWLKCWAGMDHLFSTTRQGIAFQFYVAVIAVLLMYVQLGRRVSRYALLAMQQLMFGQITFEQVLQIIEKREREKTRARERAARKRAAQKQVA